MDIDRMFAWMKQPATPEWWVFFGCVAAVAVLLLVWRSWPHAYELYLWQRHGEVIDVYEKSGVKYRRFADGTLQQLVRESIGTSVSIRRIKMERWVTDTSSCANGGT